jgi:hypothetical protein
MRKVGLVTDDDLARARQDPAFRHQLVADNLGMLLNEIKKLRASRTDAAECREIREGVKLAVQLAELLQRIPNVRPDAMNAA